MQPKPDNLLPNTSIKRIAKIIKKDSAWKIPVAVPTYKDEEHDQVQQEN